MRRDLLALAPALTILAAACGGIDFNGGDSAPPSSEPVVATTVSREPTTTMVTTAAPVTTVAPTTTTTTAPPATVAPTTTTVRQLPPIEIAGSGNHSEADWQWGDLGDVTVHFEIIDCGVVAGGPRLAGVRAIGSPRDELGLRWWFFNADDDGFTNVPESPAGGPLMIFLYGRLAADLTIPAGTTVLVVETPHAECTWVMTNAADAAPDNPAQERAE